MHKRILFYVFFILSTHTWSQPRLDYKNTHVVIAGVLQWKNKSINTFSAKNRKDKELYDQLIAMGVQDSNITLLLDSNATLQAMKSAIYQQISKCDSTGNFIFYYAGHGMKLKDGTTYFLNYDISDSAKTGFDVRYLSKTINEFFHGKNIFLLADCCYSGTLLNECNAISTKGTSAYALSSAMSSNISTVNWTFTQTLLDCLRGESLADRDGDGNITYAELSEEIKEAMKYRERQLSGFGTKNGNLNLVITASQPSKPQKTKGEKESFALGNYVIAWNKTKWEPARIVDIVNDKFQCEFYHYSDKQYETLPPRALKTYYFFKYAPGTNLEVESEGKYYPATIVKLNKEFHYVHYTNYDSYWDEWILYDRMYSKSAKRAKASYNKIFYPVIILEKKGDQYFVHYEGFNCLWDEWVKKDKMKF